MHRSIIFPLWFRSNVQRRRHLQLRMFLLSCWNRKWRLLDWDRKSYNMARRRSHHRRPWLHWRHIRLRRSSRRCSFRTEWCTVARVSRRVVSHRMKCSQPVRHFRDTTAAAVCLAPIDQWVWIRRAHQLSLRKCLVLRWNGSQLLLSHPIPSRSCPTLQTQWDWDPLGHT